MNIQAENGKFVCAEGGGGRSGSGALIANRDAAGPWETFVRVPSGAGFALRCLNGSYVCAENGGGGGVSTNRLAAGPWETFKAVTLPDGRAVLACYDGTHYLRVRTDLAQPVVDATGLLHGLTFRTEGLNGGGGGLDPSTVPLEELARIRGSMWSEKLAIPYGPRPGQPDNVLAMDFLADYNDADRRRMIDAYKALGYTHVVIGPLVDSDGYHGLYPVNDWRGDRFGEFLDLLQLLWDSGLMPVVFVHPDGWDRQQTLALGPLLSLPRAQLLMRIVVYTGWEPWKYELTNAQWVEFLQDAARIFPNALRLIHTVADVDAPTGGNDDLTFPPGEGNARSWQNAAPYLHGWLVQNAGYAVGSSPTPTPAFVQEFSQLFNPEAGRASLLGRFQYGTAGWPTSSAWGDGKRLRVYAGEYASYGQFWRAWPSEEARKLGDAAMAAGADGYLDGGTVDVPRRDR